ncbi:MAG: hypothetical protein DRP64_09650 [Verrucomicrobia bacterium]|nr:MAG: hypothetical protein DRP64_09650 [Verrucomicrobiota bacterium]
MKYLMVAGLLGMVFTSVGCCVFSGAEREASAQRFHADGALDYVHELPSEGSVAKIAVKPHNAVRFDEVAVLQEGEMLVVRGALRPKSFANTQVGYVDIRIVDAEGKLIRTLTAKPDRILFSRDRNLHPHFMVSTDLKIPAGAKVILHYRDA